MTQATFTPTDRFDEFGGMIFELKWVNNLVEMISGLPGYEHCYPSHDHPQSCRPIPEGLYLVGEPTHDHESVCNPAIGPWWIPLIPQSDIGGRDAFGMHCDWNWAYAPGTAGCPAPLKHANMPRIVEAVNQGHIKTLLVDYGYGTV